MITDTMPPATSADEIARARRERPFEIDGLPGRTQKFTIGGVDSYFTFALDAGRPAFFGMVVAGGPNRNPLLEVVFTLAMRMLNTPAAAHPANEYAALENEIMGGAPVVSACADLPYLIRAWRGTHFEPTGVCPQLGGIVSSPLDAAARYLERFVTVRELDGLPPRAPDGKTDAHAPSR